MKKILRILSVLLVGTILNIQCVAAQEPDVVEIADEKTKEEIGSRIKVLFDNQSIEVLSIESFNFLKVFSNYKLLRIFIYPSILEHVVLPGGPGYGMFAYDGDKLLYLNKDNNNLEEILWEEKHISEVDRTAKTLAIALILCKISHGQTNYFPVNNIRDISDYGKDGSAFGEYVVDRKKRKKYRKILASPRWEDKDKTKDLVFYVLSGWMHEMNTLLKITASFDKQSSYIEIKKEVVEDKVFKQTPDMIY